jgi:aerobic-type carbon monoxide dehydrogenase small subunit (CoxS/CutS family)
MSELSITVNGRRRTVAAAHDTPLLWVLRESLGLTGAKFGCGIGECGACTVHLDGKAVRSCIIPLSTVGDRAVTTIEGLARDGDHPVQQAWLAEDVPQCGYCQPGMIMAAVALLADTAQPTDQDIDSRITNICRCGTYPRIRAAIHRAARLTAQ